MVMDRQSVDWRSFWRLKGRPFRDSSQLAEYDIIYDHHFECSVIVDLHKHGHRQAFNRGMVKGVCKEAGACSTSTDSVCMQPFRSWASTAPIGVNLSTMISGGAHFGLHAANPTI